MEYLGGGSALDLVRILISLTLLTSTVYIYDNLFFL